MSRSTLILTTAGMILGGAMAIDLLDARVQSAPPKPAPGYEVVHRDAVEHTDKDSSVVPPYRAQ
ncbi:hypothetical protein [Nocardia caishijiensis]|uniref:Uncharacterized protein n=1 Tax=Nocardia caishijiensis TaxID=184756 RepID=A0ABQ6YPW4_9NOCA|nr:hypothetical protein [Nocardia caishijiensis]KAF0847824.1 hypothetical protein FNL39_103726 [Nocardia caishijiensis]